MSNKNDLIRSFVLGETKGKASNLKIEGNKLINYYTVIALRKGNDIYLNIDKYSSTTSRNQNLVRRFTNNVLIEVTEEEINNLI